MEGQLLLNVVVRKGAAILELLSGKDETLLVRRGTLLVLDLCLHVVNGVRGLDLEGDRVLTKICAPSEMEDKVAGGLLLNPQAACLQR